MGVLGWLNVWLNVHLSAELALARLSWLGRKSKCFGTA